MRICLNCSLLVGVRVMASYRIYSFDGPGRISPAEDIEALSDRDAILKVRQMKPTAIKCELWDGKRLVATLDGYSVAH